ncbi:MAG: single-stranded DNA-binding protein [Thermoplasmata archaeon]
MDKEADKEMVKVDDLSPASKRVNILVKVLDIGEKREVPSRMGGARLLAEARVGDETGTVLMTLWQDQIEQVSPGDVLLIDNGFMSLVRGHLRLNVGKYGSMAIVEEDIPEVNEEFNISDREYEMERRSSGRSDFGGQPSRGGRGRPGGRGGGRRRR